MPFSKKKLDLIALVSIIPLIMATHMIDTPVNWGMYILVFFCAIDENYKDILRRSTIASALLAASNYYWLAPSAQQQMGDGGIYIGLILLLVFCIFHIIYAGLLSTAFILFRWHNTYYKYNWLFTSLICGCILGAADIIMSWIGNGFSATMFYNYLPLAPNLYAIQPVAYIGPFVLSFMIGMTNYQVAYFLRYKRYPLLLIPLIVIIGFLCLGKFIYIGYNKELVKKHPKSLKVAIIRPDLQPSIKWDSSNGPIRIAQLLELNKDAIKHNADIAVWPLSVVPWPYTKEDDFLNEIEHQNLGSDMYYLLGIDTKAEGLAEYNSIYSFAPNGSLLGRYDKKETLFFLEKNLFTIGPSFASFKTLATSTFSSPVETKNGKVGIIINNEITISNLSREAANKGANFFIYFDNNELLPNFITNQRFFYARIRAVENRKDIILNTPNNLSYFISSSGAFSRLPNTKLTNRYCDLTPNAIQNPISSLPYSIISLLVGIPLFLGITIANFKINKNQFLK